MVYNVKESPQQVWIKLVQRRHTLATSFAKVINDIFFLNILTHICFNILSSYFVGHRPRAVPLKLHIDATKSNVMSHTIIRLNTRSILSSTDQILLYLHLKMMV